MPLRLNTDEAGFEAWNVYRGSLALLASGGAYTQPPGTHPLAVRTCGVPDPQLVQSVTPGAGKAAFYLVTGTAAGAESPLGTDSDGVPRPNTNPCIP